MWLGSSASYFRGSDSESWLGNLLYLTFTWLSSVSIRWRDTPWNHNYTCLSHLCKFIIRNCLTYSLTPWSRVLLEKPTVSQLVKKFAAFYGTRSYIIAFTSARHYVIVYWLIICVVTGQHRKTQESLERMGVHIFDK